jgi:hypothetical protein
MKLFIALLFTQSLWATEFPQSAYPVEKQAPFSETIYQKVAVGKVKKRRRNLYWRYVTFYNVEENEGVAPEYPYIEENCYNDTNRFANWSGSLNYSISYAGSVSFSFVGIELGIAAATTREQQIGFEFWMHAHDGIHARHTLYKRSKTYKGYSYRQFYNTKSGEVYYSKKKRHKKEFYLDNQQLGLFVKREILGPCN